MKSRIYLVVAIFVHLSSAAFAQKITLSVTNAPIVSVLDKIQEQSGFEFFYNYTALSRGGNVSIVLKGATVEQALDQLFKDRPFVFLITDKTIIVKIKKESPEAIKSSLALSGTVVDSLGRALNGATVTLTGGSGYYAVTDQKGKFDIGSLSDGMYQLTVTYIGFKKYVQRIELHGRSLNISVFLSNADNKLDEIHVIAYGVTTKRYDVGSVAKISEEEIRSQPVLNPLAALEGRVPGLLVTANSGIAGAAYQVQIRGQNTLGTGQTNLIPDNPLFIIDGIPYAPQNNTYNKSETIVDAGLSPFNLINPFEIESVEVLKDADATSIYGARASNGVILITTKKGKPGKTVLTGEAYTGVNSVTRRLTYLNTAQYLAMRNDAFKADGTTPNDQPGTSGYAPDLLVFDNNRYTDFFKYIYGQRSSTQNANLALTGGDDKNTFYAGLNYGRQTDMFPGDFGENKIGGNIKLHHNSGDRKFNFDVSTALTHDDNELPVSSILLNTFILPPNYPALTNPDGSLSWGYQDFGFNNYLEYLKQTNRSDVLSFRSSMLVSYEILPGLQIKTSIGYNNFMSNGHTENPISSQNPYYDPTGSIVNTSNNFYTWIVEPQISYDRQIGKGRFNLLVGSTFQKTEDAYTSISGTGYTNDSLLGSINFAKTVNSNDNNSLYKYFGGFARVNYTYDSKYIINFTGRFDGSSRFAPGKQWGRFGSVAGGYIFTNEKLFKENLPVLSFGKIKASYGTTGNDNVGNSLFNSNWSPLYSTFTYDGSVGYIPNNLENKNFSWSTTSKLDLGLALAFINDRLTFDADWFRNRTSNQLNLSPLPSQTGFTTVVQNFPGLVQNEGWEFSLSGIALKSTSFCWRTAINVTAPKNKLLAFPNLPSFQQGGKLAVGQPLSVLIGFKYAGINPTTGLYQFLNAQGGKTSSPTQNDRVVIGNTNPRLYGGWRNAFTYKNFTLDIFAEFRKQKGLNYIGSTPNFATTLINVPVYELDYWKNPGDQTKYQRLSAQSFGAVSTALSAYKMSDAVLTDASYIRLKTFGLSYTLKDHVLKALKLSSCRFFLDAENLLTITNYKGADPETQGYYTIPPLRTIAAGLDFTF
jgi:TonB-linked SusC/RagA family outer membrane protein